MFDSGVPATQPPSFHRGYSRDWGLWVLEHGLPPLPPALDDEDEVPISFWTGPRCASVVFRSWSHDPDEVDDETGTRFVQTQHWSLKRSRHGWQLEGGGGTGVPMCDPMSVDVPPRHAQLHGSFGGGGIGGVTGVVGAAAAIFVLTTVSDGTIRRPAAAPLGEFVVCFDRPERISLCILDSDGEPLLDKVLVAGPR